MKDSVALVDPAPEVHAAIPRDVTEARVRMCLRGMADDMRTYPRGGMRDFLANILTEAKLDPT